MLFSYGYGRQLNQRLQKMKANRWKFWSPCRRGNTAQCALPKGAHPWLHAKPLDATIGRVPPPYRPGGCHGWQFWMKHKNTNKTQLYLAFQCKKAKQFWDLKWTLYSHHQCDKLRTDVKHYYSSWRAQLYFELSNVVNRLKVEKLLTLKEALKKMLAKYGHSG